MMLSCTGYASSYWVTFKQAKKLGGSIKKGSRGTPVVFWNWTERKDKDTDETIRIPFLRYYTVFNLEQTDGIEIPEEVIKRIADEPKEKQAAKGIEICIEQINEVREMEGIAGVHVMAIEWEEKLNEIIGGAGLLPRPVVEQ